MRERIERGELIMKLPLCVAGQRDLERNATESDWKKVWFYLLGTKLQARFFARKHSESSSLLPSFLATPFHSITI